MFIHGTAFAFITPHFRLIKIGDPDSQKPFFFWIFISHLKGSVQIACCADETTESNPNQPPVKPLPTNDFVFE